MNEEKQITGSIPHVMNLMMIELLRYGFILGQHNELKDLQHLVNTAEECWMVGEGLICIDDEIEILEGLEDEAVKLIINSINKLTEFNDTFLLINNLDRNEVVTNMEWFEHAQDTLCPYQFEMECDGSYESTVDNLHCFYWTIEMVLFHCIMQFVHGKLEVIDETNRFYHDYHCIRGFELLTENKNVLLLLDLLPSLNEDANQIDRYHMKITNKN